MRAMLINPQSRTTFWSCRESVGMTGRKAIMPPLGLITVAAMLPKDWELRLVDSVVRTPTDNDWNWAEIVLLSGMFVHKKHITELVREARKRNKTVVVGGPYASMAPQELIEVGADYVFQGEAERGMERLLQSIASRASERIVSESEKPDLTTTPIPRFDLLDLRAYSAMAVQTNRGCPFKCEFCDVARLFGRKPRYKTVEQLIGELHYIYKLGWRGAVFISDSNFIGSESRARELLQRLIPWNQERNEPFSFYTQASVNLGQDLAMIDLMTKANFGWIFLGIETPDEETLVATGKLQNVRNPLKESVKNICANGLGVIGGFIIGFDGEKPGADRRIIDFVNETKIPVVMVNRLEVQPGTALWERLERENRLLRDPSEDLLGMGGNNFIPSRPSEEIGEELFNVRKTLYDPSAYMRRAYEYYLTMRPTRAAMGKSSDRPRKPAPPSDNLMRNNWRNEFAALARLVWRRGIVCKHRNQFWTQLMGMWRGNPSRLNLYIEALVMGENLYPFRDLGRES